MNGGKLTDIRSCDVTGRTIVIKGLSERRLRNSVFGILKDNALCSISTVTEDGHAHINTAYFCYSDELEFYFISHPRSLHCQNLATNPWVGMTIFSSSQIWTNPGRGLQVFGICREARRQQVTKAEELYEERFPGYTDWKATLGKNDLAQEYRLFRLITSRLKLHDEETFGDGVFIFAEVA
jgi:uncharacterized protein YhbP (UPF0306 family)